MHETENGKRIASVLKPSNPFKRMAVRLLALAIGCFLILHATVLFADYKDDVGFTRLADELGAGMPDGEGVAVAQVEAQNGDGHWMPDTLDAQFSGKTITDKTGGAAGSSGHATSVGRIIYGNILSMSPGVKAIEAYETNDWLQSGFLGVGYTYGGKPFQPVYDPNGLPWTLAAPARITNHSWVGTWSGVEGNVLRRLDFVVAADESIQITAINNGASNRKLLGDAYNSITVGCTDGGHPEGTSTIDSTYVTGRVCPLIVAPFTTTSSTAPMVASAAALLVEAGQNPGLSTDPEAVSTTNRNDEEIHNAQRSEVIKAALLAGARRVTDNTSSSDQITDYSQDSVNGLDRRFGAGQLDVYNSYHIIVAGEQNSKEDDAAGGGAVAAQGFDVDPAFGGSGASNTTGTYNFTPTADQRRLFAALVWNLNIHGGQWNDYDDTAVRYDLNLALYDVTASGYRRLVTSSDSTVDNTENLWATLVPGRSYEMEVTVADGQSPFGWDYALAWRMETPTDSDGDGIPDDWEVQNGLDHTDAGDADLDPDDDDLTHLEEYKNGTDPDNADSDSDGQTDGIEVFYHSDPLNPNETAAIAHVPALNPLFFCLAALTLCLSLLTPAGSVQTHYRSP